MNSLIPTQPGLLVDLETGRVLRGDDHPIISRRMADSHPFIVEESGSLFVGPDAERRARARKHAQGERNLDAIEYAISDEVAGALRLTRKIDA